MIELLNANSLQIPLADKSVHCVITSPPYWALRDYGVDGQLGLEASPFEYIERMVEVFREVWRVLRDDGTLWLNIGDSYASLAGAYSDTGSRGKNDTIGVKTRASVLSGKQRRVPSGLKPKDLVGIPWRLAFALQADGWYLRSDIIWAKPNPMPESVTDRPTKAHEYIFLLTKNERYFYDQEAIKEPSKYGPGCGWDDAGHEIAVKTASVENPAFRAIKETRNRRSVWNVPSYPYSGAHFATFPPALVEPMIKAGTSPQACEYCGAPWERDVERTPGYSKVGPKTQAAHEARGGIGQAAGTVGKSGSGRVNGYSETIGWQPTCKCPENTGAGRCVVLDPFVGSGTTLQVARKLGRSGIGLDLSFTYLRDCARERLSLTALDEWENGAPSVGGLDNLPLFEGMNL